MRDRTQGNAHPPAVCGRPDSGVSSCTSPRSALLLARQCGTRLYPGSSPTRRRRGRIRTAPALLQRLGVRTAILELPAGVYSGVACWTGDADWLIKVEIAYDLYYATLRPAVCDVHGRGGVSKRSVVAVAAARAAYAEWDTGRNSRPSVARLVRATGLSEATVQRATRILKLMGAATEVFRGRQRSRAERFASWRVRDKGRGWASVYALHPPSNPQVARAVRLANNLVTPHPLCGPVGTASLGDHELLDARTGVACRKPGRASRGPAQKERVRSRRRTAPLDPKAVMLAREWLQHPESPPWVTRHSAAGWSRVLRRCAGAGWTPEDLNQLLRDHVGLGGWIATNPHQPLRLMGWLLKKHDDLTYRPAAADMAREAEMRAAAERRRADIASCGRCGPDGYQLDGCGMPIEPVVRCDHR